MNNPSLLVISFLLSAIASLGHANSSPEPQQPGYIYPNSSAMPGESVNFDISVHFSDPDGDDLDFFLEPWSDPLPSGLSLDSETGTITGIFPDPGNKITFITALYAQDPSGARSATWGFVIWVPVSYGPVADLFYRTCDPDLYECIPGYNYDVQPRGFVLDYSPEGSSATSVFPVPPTNEETRMSASVGYDSGELTPAISTFLRPGNERMTGSQLGISKHLQTGNVTIEGELTYSQSGGVLGPDPNPVPEELPFGAVPFATIFSYQLKSEANGMLDGSRCDWLAMGGQGRDFRSLIYCVKQGFHADVFNYREAFFPLPDTGPELQGQNISTPAVMGGTTTASLSIPYVGPPDPEVFIGVELFTMARYGGEADSQNTLLVSFDDPAAMEPDMATVTEPSFVPAPAWGAFDVLINESECIHINGHGRIPVLIYGNEDIAAEDIDGSSVRMGSFPLATRGNSGPACSVEDVDLDSYPDLTCQFLDDGSPLEDAPGMVTVSFTLQGKSATYFGQDAVCLE